MIVMIIISFILWLAFIGTMQVIGDVKNKANLNLVQKIVIALFVILDVVYNYTYGTVLFLEFAELNRSTLTSRLKGYLKEQPTSWRGKLSYCICKYLISPWDWNHCGLGLGK